MTELREEFGDERSTSGLVVLDRNGPRLAIIVGDDYYNGHLSLAGTRRVYEALREIYGEKKE